MFPPFTMGSYPPLKVVQKRTAGKYDIGEQGPATHDRNSYIFEGQVHDYHFETTIGQVKHTMVTFKLVALIY